MHDLEYLFHPRSVAVVGLSPGNWGWVWPEVLQVGIIFQHLVPEGIRVLKESDEAIITAVKELGKPTAIALYGIIELQEALREEQERFVAAGLPIYSSIASAARAISKLIQY